MSANDLTNSSGFVTFERWGNEANSNSYNSTFAGWGNETNSTSYNSTHATRSSDMLESDSDMVDAGKTLGETVRSFVGELGAKLSSAVTDSDISEVGSKLSSAVTDSDVTDFDIVDSDIPLSI
mmetsp:Transcript_51271/g.116839  ORF Transcript_51271/g.116839 Transcript_51271/m.116839 type:complete len:123 (+) Transcript_51271:130-498(+)|eukprot:CAMPEP_0180276644 /NCGR_PEP_ID=MMETSP0988-20121125/6497_1 /TAXON_ID=697907 /ORGANISM="non described non described, Strain CCMP2293" /LENGTH=122 /DNA_ID=CAMNT_0022248013 /DNA_START=161 /DNA_END=529 /DNA_ORIENTATION=+